MVTEKTPYAKKLRQMVEDAAKRPKNFRHEPNVQGRGKIYLYDVISNWWGVTAEDMVKAIHACAGRPIDMYINSPGGDVFEAQAMKAEVNRYSAEIVSHVDGLCASAATTVACATDKRIISNGARFMIHRSWSLAIGNATELRDLADFLDTIDQDAAADYAAVTGQSEEDCLAWMNAETWFNAKEAVEKGFCDELTESGGNDREVSDNAYRSNMHRLANYADMLALNSN